MGEIIIAMVVGGCMIASGILMRWSLVKERRELALAAAPELRRRTAG